jgi:biopolymer transport protein ExbD
MQLAAPRKRRTPSLTPMIDVVFLLLVFFMLASRFGVDMRLPLKIPVAGGAGYSGPPRLLDVGQDGLRLNGAVIAGDDLPGALRALMTSDQDTIVLRPGETLPLQDLIAVLDELGARGFGSVVVVE